MAKLTEILLLPTPPFPAETAITLTGLFRDKLLRPEA
ncbi:Uncharacterised protein [Legionella pneumophila]|nr:Uncharacterised protein [Legionella pneumophila]